jgi:hypothetical protein
MKVEFATKEAIQRALEKVGIPSKRAYEEALGLAFRSELRKEHIEPYAEARAQGLTQSKALEALPKPTKIAGGISWSGIV